MTEHTENEQLLDYAYGELGQRESVRFEDHLKTCSQCADELASIRGVRKTMARLSPEPAPGVGLESLQAYAEQSVRRQAAGHPTSSPWKRWVVALSAGAAVVVIGGVVTEVMKGGSPGQARLEKALDEQVTAAQPAPVLERSLPQTSAKDEVPPAAVVAPPPPPSSPKADSRRRFAKPPPLAVKREAPAPASAGRGAMAADQVETASPTETAPQADLAEERELPAAMASPPPSPTMAPEPSLRAPSAAPARPSAAPAKKQASAPSAAGAVAPAEEKAKRMESSEDAVGSSMMKESAKGAGDYRQREVVSLKAVLATNPRGTQLEQTLLSLCRLETELGHFAQARLYCERLVRERPTSPWADEARRRLKTLPQ